MAVVKAGVGTSQMVTDWLLTELNPQALYTVKMTVYTPLFV